MEEPLGLLSKYARLSLSVANLVHEAELKLLKEGKSLNDEEIGCLLTLQSHMTASTQ